MILLSILAFIIIILMLVVYSYITRGICKCSIHLVNKVAIVTGANSGIGFEIAKSLAERGARVILACRNEQRATTAVGEIKRLTRNEDVHYRHLDLASIRSVSKFATEFMQTEKRLDILIHNAGTIKGVNEKTVDGFSELIQSNHLSPSLLTLLLLPLLKTSAPSRIINTSSIAHAFFNIDPEDLGAIPESKTALTNALYYSRTKLCNVLMTLELDRRLKGSGVTANCLHPGMVKTSLLFNPDAGVARKLSKILYPFLKTPWEGAQTAIYLAVSPEVETSSGGYYVDCKLVRPGKKSQNPELARKLWETTVNLVSDLNKHDVLRF